jgi:hypothetical protein
MAGETVVSVGSAGQWKGGVVPEGRDDGGKARVKEEAGAVGDAAGWWVRRRVDMGAVAVREGGDGVETGALPA